MFNYSICNEPDREVFIKQCKALEKYIPDIDKGELLEDVDGSETQLYTVNGKKISVHNSQYIGAVFVDSDIDLKIYFHTA